MDKQKKHKEKHPQKFDLKRLIMGGTKEITVTDSRFPNGTQSMVPVVDIQNGVIITEDGRYIKSSKFCRPTFI